MGGGLAEASNAAASGANRPDVGGRHLFVAAGKQLEGRTRRRHLAQNERVVAAGVEIEKCNAAEQSFLQAECQDAFCIEVEMPAQRLFPDLDPRYYPC